MSKSGFSTRVLTTLALLTALEIALSRFLSINAWNTKIGFSFVPIVAAAILYGPAAAGIVGALGDFIGAILFPIGAYFPGFTLTAFLTGCVFGLFLHRKEAIPVTPAEDGEVRKESVKEWLRILAAVGINQLILSLFLNTLWISVLYGSPYLPLLATRLVQCVIMTVVQIVCIRAMQRTIARYGKKIAVVTPPSAQG